MDNYTPNEIKDIKAIKQRVMETVVQEIQNKRQKTIYRWRYITISTILTLSVMFFMLNQIENETQHLANAPQIDFTQPTFYEEQGLFYLQGFTLGESKSQVVELLGGKAIEVEEDGSGADFILEYGEEARFYFYQDTLFRILLLNVNDDQFEQLFNEYKGSKFKSNESFYLFSSDSSRLIKAQQTPMGDLYLYLLLAEPENLLEFEGQ